MGEGKGAGKTAPTDTEIINGVAFDLAGIKFAAIAPVGPHAAAVLEPTYIDPGAQHFSWDEDAAYRRLLDAH